MTTWVDPITNRCGIDWIELSIKYRSPFYFADGEPYAGVDTQTREVFVVNARPEETDKVRDSVTTALSNYQHWMFK